MRRTAAILPLLLLSCRYFAGAESYEESATRAAIGIDVRVAPVPEGPEGFLELSSSGTIEILAEEIQGSRPILPEPSLDRPADMTLVREGPEARLYEARMGWWEDADGPRPDWMPKSTTDNVRHKYAGMAGYCGFDVLIGAKEGFRTRPLLYFRDLGTHANKGVIDFAVDARGRVHLLDMDVDISQGNRGKLLYLIGDPETHRWEEAWLLHHRPRFTSVSNSALLVGESSTVFVWTIDGARDPADQGVFFAERKGGAFSHRTRIDPERATRVAIARDPAGALLVVYMRELSLGPLLARLRRPDGTWTEAAPLKRLARFTDALSLFAVAPGKFVLREYHWSNSFDRKKNESSVREQQLTVVLDGKKQK